MARSAGLPFKTDSIESIIELVGVGLPQTTVANNTPIYYLLSDFNVTQHFHQEAATSALWRTLNSSANGVILLNGSSSVETPLLPPSASSQALLNFFIHREHPISHTIISDRPAGPPFADYFFDSFLDVQWPAQNASDEYLNRLANLLADALHRVGWLSYIYLILILADLQQSPGTEGVRRKYSNLMVGNGSKIYTEG